jgi:hypothetical protein
MRFSSLRVFAAALSAAVLLVAAEPAFAQNGDQKPPEKPPVGDTKDAPKKVDEFAEAEKVLGGPSATSISTIASVAPPATSRRRSAVWSDRARQSTLRLTRRRPIRSTAGCTAAGSIPPPRCRERRRRRRAAPPTAKGATANLYEHSAKQALSCTDVQNDCLDFLGTFFLLSCLLLEFAMTGSYLLSRDWLRYALKDLD